MNIDRHVALLHNYCRMCTNKLNRNRYSCEEYAEELKEIWKIDVSKDEKDVHPRNFCHACRCVIGRARDAKQQNEIYKPTSLTETASWSKHPRMGSCQVCDMFETKRKGGRKKKAGFRGHVVSVSNEGNVKENITETIQSASGPSLKGKLDLEVSRFKSPPHRDLLCKICFNVLDSPVQLSCQHCFCGFCIKRWLWEKMECPVCKTKTSCKDIMPMHRALINILSELEVQCEVPTCQTYVPLCSLRLHMSECSGIENIIVNKGEINTLPVSTSTVQQIVNAPPSEPLTATEEDILTALFKRKSSQIEDGSPIPLKTGGQV